MELRSGMRAGAHFFIAVALAAGQEARAGVVAHLDSTAAYRASRTSGPPAVPRSAYLAAEAGTPQSGTAEAPGHAARKAWGVAVLEQPLAAVWKAVNDELAFPALTRVSHSILIQGRAGHARRLVFHYLPLSVVEDRWWVTRVDHNAALYRASAGRLWELTWSDDFDAVDLSSTPAAELSAGGRPVEFTRGAWLVSAVDESRTLLEYHSHADPGGALPAAAVSRFAAGGILDTLACVQTLAARHAKTRTAGFVRPDGQPLP